MQATREHVAGHVRELSTRLTKLPWIPTEAQWRAILGAAADEPIRNRVMLALAYDAALRREELCSLRTDDLDPAYRTLRVRAETTKGRRERVVPYSATTGVLLGSYLAHRATLTRARGGLFLSESRRNHAQPLTLWSWSKFVRRIALAGDGCPAHETAERRQARAALDAGHPASPAVGQRRHCPGIAAGRRRGHSVLGLVEPTVARSDRHERPRLPATMARVAGRQRPSLRRRLRLSTGRLHPDRQLIELRVADLYLDAVEVQDDGALCIPVPVLDETHEREASQTPATKRGQALPVFIADGFKPDEKGRLETGYTHHDR
ncbi:tyrosine-type recombinase/integrase [Streptosporangium amethystogenes]|uniref:tyrosine-type recombinase/integrase n=1 Tax=Streptosporangium amethystogenes TaxID=2002 RepID=UPI00378FEBAC